MAQGVTDDPWAPCIASLEDESPSGGAGAPFYPQLRWEKKQLKVKFMGGAVPAGWRLMTPPNKPIDTTMILEWANVWSNEQLGLKGTIPEFVECTDDDDEGDIRVEFSSDLGSESLIGSEATSHQGKRTMVLNLSHNNDDYRKYLVIHEFGHALGLGHEHQTTRLAGALDKDETIKMLQKWKMTKSQAEAFFKVDYETFSSDSAPEEGSAFDPWSMMCYPIPECCFKKSGREKYFTDEQFKMITTQCYDERKYLSEIDIESVWRLYTSDKPSKPPLEKIPEGVAGPIGQLPAKRRRKPPAKKH